MGKREMIPNKPLTKKACSRVAKRRSPIKGKEDRYVAKHHQGSVDITRDEFEALVTKASQPLSESKHAPKETQTSVVHPSDGCTETHKNQDKTEDKEGLQSD
jgi:hypothetical protein